MLTGEMQLWHGLVIAGVSLFLQTCLLVGITYLLSRHIAQQSEQILKKARSQVQAPSPDPQQPPAAKGDKETWTERSTLVSAPRYRDASSTSSESSDSSDSSPPTRQATKEVNYTQVVFSAPGELKNDSVLDYENINEATDYVNVSPKSHKPSVWTSVNSAVSEPVEYTQVAV